MADANARGSSAGALPMSFLAVYGQAFVRPARAMEAVLVSHRQLRWGAWSVATTACTYLLVYYFLAHNGGRPTVFEPWLAIEPEDYYRYNLVLHVPSVGLAWVSAAGFAYLTARGLGGTGSYDGTLSTLGLGIGVASWATGLHDVLTTFLGFIGVLDQRAYEDAMSTAGTAAHVLIWALMLLYFAAFLVLFTQAMRTTHRLSRARSLAAGTVGFGVYQTIFALFNR